MSPHRDGLRPLLTALVWLGVGLLTVLVLVTMLQTRTLVGETRKTQTTNTGTLQNSKQTLDRINDCTTPGRKCYDEGQKRTGEVVGSLNEVTIASSSYAAACAAKGLADADAIYRCVLAEFDKQKKP